MKSKTEGLIGATLNYTFIGLSFLFTKISVSVAPTFIVLSIRFIISLVIITPLLFFNKGFNRVKESLHKDWKFIIIFSIFQPILFFMFQAFALARIDSTEVGLVSSTSPALVAILGLLFLKELLNKRKILGLAFSLGGITFIYIMKGALSQTVDLWGLIFIIFATLSGGIYQVMGRRLAKQHDPISLAYIRIVFGSLIFPILAGITGDWGSFDFTSLSSPGIFILGILYLAIFTTVGTSLLTVYSLKRLKAAEQGIFANLATIISIIAGILFLSEEFFWYQGIGGIMVIVGVILMNYSKKN